MTEFAGRVEDQRFLTGRGRFIEDLVVPVIAHAWVLRSPVAHGRITRLDTDAAQQMPGVLTVLSGGDLAAAGLGPLRSPFEIISRDATPMVQPPRHALARDVVRHVGDPVAVVVAESTDAARDAGERIVLELEPMDRVTQPDAAVLADAPRVWPEAPGNLCFDWEDGDAGAVDAAFAAAADTCAIRVVNNRIVMAPVEPRGAIGQFDPATGTYTLHTPTQGVHRVGKNLAEHVFAVPADRIHVLTQDVGGSFGLKEFTYPEQVLVLHAAKVTGRPVRWIADRSESFLSDAAGRDHVSTAELALDRSGRFLALRVATIANLGAYISTYAPPILTDGVCKAMAHVYDIPAVHVGVRAVFTNTTPVDAFRGAGVPEAINLVERLIEKAARERGDHRVGLRRRNLIPPDKMPYKRALGTVIDCGDFNAVLDRALELADWDGFAARRAAAEGGQRLRGIGLAFHMHRTGGSTDDSAEVSVHPEGTVLLRSGAQSSGQGHETVLADIVARRLGIDPSVVRVQQGDSALLGKAGGTGGSSVLTINATTALQATEAMLAASLELAGEALEAAAADITYADGHFTVVGTDRAISLFALAERAGPPGAGSGCFGSAEFDGDRATFPNGAYIAEVEIDPETGAVTVERFTAVDDVGRVYNPTILAGQIHGGVAQGIGQALLEDCHFEPETGQLLAGSLMDYALPRAADLPSLTLAQVEIPTDRNVLGAKGVGEISAIGAPPAVIHAVLDALVSRGVADIDMPATPLRIWEALQAAR